MRQSDGAGKLIDYVSLNVPRTGAQTDVLSGYPTTQVYGLAIVLYQTQCFPLTVYVVQHRMKSVF